jgi:hypothetical protein
VCVREGIGEVTVFMREYLVRRYVVFKDLSSFRTSNRSLNGGSILPTSKVRTKAVLFLMVTESKQLLT